MSAAQATHAYSVEVLIRAGKLLWRRISSAKRRTILFLISVLVGFVLPSASHAASRPAGNDPAPPPKQLGGVQVIPIYLGTPPQLRWPILGSGGRHLP
jgi:hypothetical protein